LTLRDWIIIVGVVLALPAWGYAVYFQWSKRQGAMGKMLRGSAVFAAIILAATIATFLAG